MGIGTLIIFIALLLVAAIAAGVLIFTSGSMQEKSLSTATETKNQIGTNLKVVEVSGTDGSQGNISKLEMIMKLSPGSEPIKLKQAIMTLNTFDKTASLTYAGINASIVNNRSGYYTTKTISPHNHTFNGSTSSYVFIETDYDFDGKNESLWGGIGAAVPVLINLSSVAGNGPAPGGTPSLGRCSSGTFVPNNNLSSDSSGFLSSSTLGCNGSNVTWVYIVPATPSNEGNGSYAVEYLQRGNNWINGNIQRGDIIKIYIEPPRDIEESETIRINFIPKSGTPTLTEFITPEVISTERVYLH